MGIKRSFGIFCLRRMRVPAPRESRRASIVAQINTWMSSNTHEQPGTCHCFPVFCTKPIRKQCSVPGFLQVFYTVMLISMVRMLAFCNSRSFDAYHSIHNNTTTLGTGSGHFVEEWGLWADCLLGAGTRKTPERARTSCKSGGW